MSERPTIVDKALQLLTALGLPRAQINERSALCLLALLDLKPDASWAAATDPLMGVTPIMAWAQGGTEGVVPSAATTSASARSSRRSSAHTRSNSCRCPYFPLN